ncbi:MAG: hypothetical protein AB1551_07190, partial [Actinomycetota bacterium]
MNLELRNIRQTGPFEFRWPVDTESFDHGWEGTVVVEGRRRRFRHGIGARDVYGRQRVHSVTWLDGQPVVEGVEADDYGQSGALLCRIKGPDRKMARAPAEIPPGHEGFEIVVHRDEIDAPYSPWGLAVKVPEDDLESWARLAVLRARGEGPATGGGSRPPSPPRPTTLAASPGDFEPIPRERKLAIARELVHFEEEMSGPLRRGIGKLTEDERPDRLVHENGFAFLLAVLFDQQVAYGKAWGAPLELKRRLGHLDPLRMLREPQAVAEAIGRRPALHRYVNKMPLWTLEAARRVVEEFGGQAEAIWGDRPTARELQERLDSFLGISQKKAAMTVMLLWRNCNV